MRRAGLVLLVAGAAACGGGGGGDEAEVTPLVPVGTGVAASDTVTDVITVTGRLTTAPGGSALLAAPAPAVVRAVPVQIGSAVGKDQLLVDLDAPELETSARSLAAQADIAERDAARQQGLLRDGITSKRQADEKEAEAVAARAAANAAKQLLARSRVTSPIAGRVQRVLVHPGERVEAGAPLVEVIDAATVDLLAAVPAAELSRIGVGATALIQAEGAEAPVAGRVVAVAPAVDSLTNAGQVVIRAANGRGTLRPGTGAVASIAGGARHHGIVVPDSALVIVGDSLAVFVVGKDSVAHARGVTVGMRRNGLAEIVRGLTAGEVVVISGAFGLSDGTRVAPAAPAKP